MRIKMKIGQLVEAVAAFQNQPLENEKEVLASDLRLAIARDDGHLTEIRAVIKKHSSGVRLVFNTGHVLRCSSKHILRQNGSPVFVEHLRVGSEIDTTFGSLAVIEITPDDGVEDYYDIGIDAPHWYHDAAGIIHHNTIITATLSSLVEPYGRSIVIVPNKSLVKQTEEDYINLGLDVGVFFGERKEWNKTHTICTWQSLAVFAKKTRRDEAAVPLEDFIADVVCIMVDEAHSAKAKELKELLSGAFAHIPIRWGLTGTIPKEPFEHLSLFACIGPNVGEVRAAELQEKGVLANCMVNVRQLKDEALEFKTYHEELEYLVSDAKRISHIADMCREISGTGNTLILVDRVEFGNKLKELIPGAVFVSGATKMKDRSKEYKEVAQASDKVIIATYGVAAVGINIPRIFNLVLIEAGKSFVRTIQSIGRGLRKAQDKDEVQIYDVCSTLKFSSRHLTKRKQFYRDAEYPFQVEKIDISS